MTIVCATDLHGTWGPLYSSVDAMQKGDWLLLLGDLDLVRPLSVMMKPFTQKGINVRWVAGNHDFEYHPILEAYDFLRGHAESAPWELHCRVEEMDGLRVAGLSGTYGHMPSFESPNERKYFRDSKGRLPQDMEHLIFREDIDALLELGPVDVLISHECPTDHFELQVLAMALQTKLWVHGHHHRENVNFMAHGGQVRCLEAERPWRLKLPDQETGL